MPQIIHKRRKEEIAVEQEKRRKEQEEAVNKEADLGKRKQLEEDEAKAQRLSDLKAKAEALRQEKSTLFGMLKQALIEETKKKQREEKAERLRKEEQDKKDKKERALAEAAQALAGANVHAPTPPGMNAMMASKIGGGQMGSGGMTPAGIVGIAGLPGMPMTYGHKPPGPGTSYLSPRQGFFGTQAQDSPRGLTPQGTAPAPPGGNAGRLHPYPPSQPPPGASPYGSPQVGVGAPPRPGMGSLGALQGQTRFLNMQAYQQNALLGRMASGTLGGGRVVADNRPPPPTAPPPMDGRDLSAAGQQQQQGQQPPGHGGRGRGIFGFPPGSAAAAAAAAAAAGRYTSSWPYK